MTVAILKVSKGLDLDFFFTRLPNGYKVIGEKDNFNLSFIELTIDGPFPAYISDGTEVESRIIRMNSSVKWQWMVNGIDHGEPLEIYA